MFYWVVAVISCPQYIWLIIIDLFYEKILLEKGLSLCSLLPFLLILFAKSVYAVTFHSLYKIVLCLEVVFSSVIKTRSFLPHGFWYIFFFTILQFFNFVILFSFLIKLWMICLCVAKDNHCPLASLPQYMELSLILHYMRDGFIYG